MRILVTGGAGYIDSHAVKLFLARGHDVWIVDNLCFGHRQAVPAERLVVADLNEIHRLDQLLVERRIEAVVHFAAFAFVGESVTNRSGASTEGRTLQRPPPLIRIFRPPSAVRSSSSVSAPWVAAKMAASVPAAPAPMTATRRRITARGE